MCLSLGGVDRVWCVRALNFCMVKDWPTETFSKNVETGDAAGLRGEARGGKRMK